MLVEVCMVKVFGGDLVGMSIVFEVIVVCYVGLEVFGILLVINLVVGISDQLFDHVEVIEVGCVVV